MTVVLMLNVLTQMDTTFALVMKVSLHVRVCLHVRVRVRVCVCVRARARACTRQYA